MQSAAPTHRTGLPHSLARRQPSSSMSPTVRSGGAEVPDVLRLGRAQLWFGCIVYFYCWMLTLVSLLSEQWVCSLGAIPNSSCPQCPTWVHEHDKDEYQRGLLAAATVLGALGYVALCLRWLPLFARFPVLKLLSLLLLAAVVVLDFEAHDSYHRSYGTSFASAATGNSLFYCTAYEYAQIAAAYGCIAAGLLLWHEGVEWTVRRRMRKRRDLRRLTRAQQQQRVADEWSKPVVVVEQPTAGVDDQPPAPLQVEEQKAAPPSAAHPTSVAAVSSLPPQHGAASIASSAHSAALTAPLPSASSNSPSPAPLPASLAAWCERLGLYTRPSTRLDSVALKWTWKDQLSPIQRRLVLSVNVFFSLLYFGGLAISSIEGWALQDGVNYILSSWVTLGYGLFTPITTGGRVFMYVYWPVGFVVISSTSTTIWRVVLARTDHVLKDTAERLLARRHTGRAALNSQQLAARHANTQAATSRAHDGDSDSEKEKEGRRQQQRRNQHPALKDIVFSPSRRRATAAAASSSAHADQPLSSILSQRPTRQLLDDSTSATAPSEPIRRASLPDGAARRSGQYTPTASYPLTWGRGNMSLTVYEAPHQPTTRTSLTDLFAPLNNGSAAPSAPVVASAAHTAQAANSTSAPLSSHQPVPASQQPPAVERRGMRSPNLTLVSSSLRDDFLAHLRQQTSHEQLQHDIRRHRNSTSDAHYQQQQQQQQQPAPRLAAVHEDDAASDTDSGQTSSSSQPPSNASHSQRPIAAAGLHSPALPASRQPLPFSATASAARRPVLRELLPLLLKLAIAVTAVVLWTLVAGGVFVWSEGGRFGYWDSQWSAFNLLTTISIGTLATPFSIRTSAFLVWYLLLGVGTLAYCFALIAQVAFIAFDKREAASYTQATRGGVGGSMGAALGTEQSSRAQRDDEAGFVAHAKELDGLILQLVQQQAAAIDNEADADKQHAAFMRSPVLMFNGAGASGEQVEVPLEGVSLLLRYHLAFQAFEKERARISEQRRAAAERRARQRGSGPSKRHSSATAGAQGHGAVGEDGGEAAGAAESIQRPDEQLGGVGAGEADGGEGDEDEDEQRLAGDEPSDRLFDWNNDKAWIAQAEQESASVDAEPEPTRIKR